VLPLIRTNEILSTPSGTTKLVVPVVVMMVSPGGARYLLPAKAIIIAA
jgi:hypothetical protein